MSASPQWTEIREEEVPAPVWQFQLWLKCYWQDQGEPAAWSWYQFNEVKAEAARRGIRINPDGVIEFSTQ